MMEGTIVGIDQIIGHQHHPLSIMQNICGCSDIQGRRRKKMKAEEKKEEEEVMVPQKRGSEVK
jgi:hypothetical protein